MKQNQILIVEDEKPTLNFLAQTLTAQGFVVTKAENGQEALQLYQSMRFPVILTDLEMPLMRGEEFISEVMDLDSICPPMIIVLTSHDESNLIVGVMKKGVLDYLIKPAKSEEIISKVKYAAKSYELKSMQIASQKEREIRLKEQLDWLKYKRDFTNKEFNSFNENLIHNMRHNLGQSGGFGNLISLLELIYSDAKKDGDEIRIGKDIFELLRQSVQLIDNTFSSLESISKILESEINLERFSISEVYNHTTKLLASLTEIAKIGSHNIVLADKKESFENRFIDTNLEYIDKIINELLLNAFKFSETETKIFIIFRIEEKQFVFSLINEPKRENSIIGVPFEYSNLIFEPFYRINRFLYEKYKSLDLGLGLPMVKTIIQKMRGEISISNMMDFTSVNSQNTKVNVEVSIPLV